MIGMISQAAADRCVSLPFKLKQIPARREARFISPSVSVCYPVGGPFERTVTMVIKEAVGELAVKGCRADCLGLKALFPEDIREEDIRSLFQEAAGFCEKYALEVCAPKAVVSSCVSAPVLSVTACGEPFSEGADRLRAEHFHIRVADPGTQLVMAGYAGDAGAGVLAGVYKDELRKRFNPSFAEDASDWERRMCVSDAAKIACGFAPQCMISAAEGGIFRALWEIAQEMGAGFDLDLRKIILRQETVEICEWLDLNPYQLYAAGAVLIVTDQGEELCEALNGHGIEAAVLGRMTNRNARILHNADEARYLEKPQQDMLWAARSRWGKQAGLEEKQEKTDERTNTDIS